MSQLSFNDFKTKLRNFVLADSTVNSLIPNKFFGAQLATLYNTSGTSDWPKACFWSDSGVERHWMVLQQFPLNVWVYSESSYDEAHDVLNAIRNRLNKALINGLIHTHPLSIPIEKYEEEPRLYGVGMRFQVNRLQAET